MACLCLFKNKKKAKARPEQSPATAPPPNVSTSRPDDAAAGKRPGKSPASTSSPQASTSSPQASTSSLPASTSSPPASTSLMRTLVDLFQEKAHNLRVFAFDELSSATTNFNRLFKLGEGGFGSVYAGVIEPSDGEGDPIMVAVKKLNQRGVQGHSEWLTEVQFLGVVDHPNLVKLIGYCAANGGTEIQRLLVYEFMPNNSLADHLFKKDNPALSWDVRLQIALGAAEGLAYLHEGLEIHVISDEGLETQVIYRDFKASNVLLDNEFRPKLSDFGMVREGPTEGESNVITGPMGTFAYAAPEYLQTGTLSAACDVFSFGVVLYEILTGREAFEKNRPKNEQWLLQWVQKFPEDSVQFSMMMDPRLHQQYSRKAARLVAELANSCVRLHQNDRPKMRQVIECLKEAIQMSTMQELPSTSSQRKQKRGDGYGL